MVLLRKSIPQNHDLKTAAELGVMLIVAQTLSFNRDCNMKICYFLMLLILSSSAFCNTCENIRDEYDRGYCFNKKYPIIDAELNSNYGELSALLTKQQNKTLKKIQLKWMEQRNSACSMTSNNKFYIDMKCATETTNTQNEFLKDQISICKSGICAIASDDEKPEPIQKGKYKASYYNGKKFVASEVVDAISIHYPYNEFRGIPSESFHATWETDIEAKEDTTLILSVSVSWSDVSIYVDDDPLTSWSNNSKEQPIKISKGSHRVKIEYTNHWHTVNFNASFETYPKLTMGDAIQQITPLLSSSTKTLYVGAYESKNIYNEVVVKIKRSKVPVVLFLGSYEAIRWKIENPQNTIIKAVFFDSYDPGSAVSISDSKTKVFKLQGVPYAYEHFEAARSFIQRVSGVIPSYTYGEYGLTQVEIPEL